MAQVECQLADIHNADYHELGAAMDMIKDLAETIYYCTITEAMEKSEKEGQHKEPRYYEYIPMHDTTMDKRDIDRRYGRMYYDPAMDYNYPKYYGENTSDNGNRTSMNYTPSVEMRDYREGRSPMSRKMYMESKELHQPKEKKMKELETYMKELSEDVTEMIEGASPEEKQLLHNKIATLANKIV